MGLSAFEETSSPSPYCCPSIDRSLTKRLIECSNNPSKVNSSCFAHTPEWVDGLDIWSSSQISSTKTDVPRRQLDFHRDIGLYLPRHEKPNSAPISTKNLHHHHHHHHPTAAITHLPPERLRILIRKEKDLLLQNDPPKPPVLINHPSPSLQTPPPLPVAPTNTTRQVPSVESEVRLPLRHTPNKPLSPPPQPPLPPKLNQDTLKSLLKEHLTSLLTRGASTINTHRSILNTPSLELRQQLRSEPKLTEERLSKLDEFIPTQQMKTNQTSPLIFYQRSTLGLTVTPVDLCSQRNIQSVSLEKMAQQRTNQADSDVSSVNSSRPSTQPIPLPPSSSLSNHLHHPTQRVILRKNFETTNPSPIDTNVSNESSTNKFLETSQHPTHNQRKLPSQNRSASKNPASRATVPTAATTIELLPPIIAGKRLHIPLANHRYL